MVILAKYSPAKLRDLANKANEEGERKIHLLAEYSEVYASPRKEAKHWTEVELVARYWHGRAKREITLGVFDSRENDIKLEVDLSAALADELIENLGLEVGTKRYVRNVRGRRLKYHEVVMK